MLCVGNTTYRPVKAARPVRKRESVNSTSLDGFSSGLVFAMAASQHFAEPAVDSEWVP